MTSFACLFALSAGPCCNASQTINPFGNPLRIGALDISDVCCRLMWQLSYSSWNVQYPSVSIGASNIHITTSYFFTVVQTSTTCCG